MALEAVFLDVGNTLVKETPSRFEIYARAARRRGAVDLDAGAMLVHMREAHEALPQRIDGAYRYSDPWFAAYVRRIFVETLGLSVDFDELLAELFETFEDPSTFELYPGALELFDLVREHKLGLGIISNWSARLPLVLEGLGIRDRFDFVLCSAIEEMEKPEPRIFEEALRRAGVSPAEALHAGDHPEKDVAAALRVGIEAVLVDHRSPRGLAPEAEPAAVAPAPRARSLHELQRYISERTR